MSVRGIVRRIDELGRIVIPKEIRRTMKLREGDEMEIVADGDSLILRKYSAFDGYKASAGVVVQMIYDYIENSEVFVVTADKLVAVAAKGKSRFDNVTVSASLSRLVSSRSSVVLTGGDMEVFDGFPQGENVLVVEPIIARGDSLGAIVVRVQEMPDENKLGYIRFAAAMLSAVVAE